MTPYDQHAALGAQGGFHRLQPLRPKRGDCRRIVDQLSQGKRAQTLCLCLPDRFKRLGDRPGHPHAEPRVRGDTDRHSGPSPHQKCTRTNPETHKPIVSDLYMFCKPKYSAWIRRLSASDAALSGVPIARSV